MKYVNARWGGFWILAGKWEILAGRNGSAGDLHNLQQDLYYAYFVKPQPDQRNAIHRRILRNMGMLVFMVMIAGFYIGWSARVGTFTGSNRWDGLLGILLGLYICSHPAANMLDMLLFMPADTREGLLKDATGWSWLFLNALVFLAAWAVIFKGILLLVSRVE